MRVRSNSLLLRQFPGLSSSTTTMTAIDRCLASMARLSIAQMARPSPTPIPRFLAPAIVQQTRQASVVRIKKVTKKRAIPKDFRRQNLDKRQFPQFSLCEAMRYKSDPQRNFQDEVLGRNMLIKLLASCELSKLANHLHLSNTKFISTSRQREMVLW